MSPEQLDGRADQRSDIFAFGAVLFEMLTGRKAFEGETSSAVIGAVVHTDPPAVSSLRPEVSPPLERVVRRCLAKDPDARWQSTVDLVDELKWIAGQPMPGVDRIAVSGACSTFGGGGPRRNFRRCYGMAVWSQLRISPPSEAASVRFIVPPPEDLNFRGMMALSPDGQRLALVTIDDKRRTQLWVRLMSSEVARTRRWRPMAPPIHSGHSNTSLKVTTHIAPRIANLTSLSGRKVKFKNCCQLFAVLV